MLWQRKCTLLWESITESANLILSCQKMIPKTAKRNGHESSGRWDRCPGQEAQYVKMYSEITWLFLVTAKCSCGWNVEWELGIWERGMINTDQGLELCWSISTLFEGQWQINNGFYTYQKNHCFLENGLKKQD